MVTFHPKRIHQKWIGPLWNSYQQWSRWYLALYESIIWYTIDRDSASADISLEDLRCRYESGWCNTLTFPKKVLRLQITLWHIVAHLLKHLALCCCSCTTSGKGRLKAFRDFEVARVDWVCLNMHSLSMINRTDDVIWMHSEHESCLVVFRIKSDVTNSFLDACNL